LVNGFGEARSEARRANVGGPKGREHAWVEFFGRGQPAPTPPATGFGECCKLPSGVWGGASAEPRPPKGFPAF